MGIDQSIVDIMHNVVVPKTADTMFKQCKLYLLAVYLSFSAYVYGDFVAGFYMFYTTTKKKTRIKPIAQKMNNGNACP